MRTPGICVPRFVAQPRPPTCESPRARTRVIWKTSEVGRGGSVTQWRPGSAGIPVSRISWHTSSSTRAALHPGFSSKQYRSDPSRRSTSSGRSLPTRTQRSGATRARRISFAGTIVCWTLTAVSAPVPRLWDLQRSPHRSSDSFAIKPLSSTRRRTTGPVAARWNSASLSRRTSPSARTNPSTLFCRAGHCHPRSGQPTSSTRSGGC